MSLRDSASAGCMVLASGACCQPLICSRNRCNGQTPRGVDSVEYTCNRLMPFFSSASSFSFSAIVGAAWNCPC